MKFTLFFFFLKQAGVTETKHRAQPGVVSNTNTTRDSRQATILDESTLFKLVSHRLDLAISQNLLSQIFERSIIKKCWENQLRMKGRAKNKRNLISNIQFVSYRSRF
jgi:hypothetical protein